MIIETNIIGFSFSLFCKCNWSFLFTHDMHVIDQLEFKQQTNSYLYLAVIGNSRRKLAKMKVERVFWFKRCIGIFSITLKSM